MPMQVVVQNLVSKMEVEEEMAAAVFKRFGDEQSTLLDKYERLSFEVQLNRAILGRSLSEPAVERWLVPSPPLATGKQQGRRRRPSRGWGWGFQKAVKKLLSPIVGRKQEGRGRKDYNNDEGGAGPNEKESPMVFWKAFSRSLRV